MSDDSHAMTWVALLGAWTDMARAAVALPKDAHGDRWREAIVPIISLQAVTHALGELHELAEPERLLGLDRATVLIERDGQAILELWGTDALPEGLTDLLTDAGAALRAARTLGFEWQVVDEVLIAPHPAEVQVVLGEAGFEGDLYLPSPGVPLFSTSPAAHCTTLDGRLPPDEVTELISAFLGAAGEPLVQPARRHVYRQYDFARGGPYRDFVTTSTQEPGQALLVPVLLNGVLQSVALPPRGPLLDDALPVVHAQDDG